MTHVEYKGFEADVKFNERNGVYSARAKGLAGLYVYAEGRTPEGLEQDFRRAVDRYIEYTDELGAAYVLPFAA